MFINRFLYDYENRNNNKLKKYIYWIYNTKRFCEMFAKVYPLNQFSAPRI